MPIRHSIPVLLVGCALSAIGQPPPDDGIDFVTIGDPGNRAYDRPVITPPTGATPGRVDYEYRISTREVETGQWIEFLNTFSTQSDSLADALGTPRRWAGQVDTTYTGPGTRYTFLTALDTPARQPIWVSWENAARYINWLNNGKPSNPASLENGAYDTSLFTQHDDNTFNHPDIHAPGSHYWLPTRDEWLKAAHWDPDKDGQGGWWRYSHGSDDAPIGGLPGTPGAETNAISSLTNPPSDLVRALAELPNGLYPQTTSPWGLEDITGGAREWNVTWSNDEPFGKTVNGSVASGNTGADLFEIVNGTFPQSRFASFRIASVIPAPSSFLVLAGAGIATTIRRRRTCSTHNVQPHV